MTLEDHEQTRRHFDVIAEGLRSEIRQVAEGVTMTNDRLDRVEGEVEAFRTETARQFQAVGAEFRAVRAEAQAFRAETAQEFKALRTETAQEFKAFRAETARSFADVRSQIGSTSSDVDRRLRAVESR